MPTTRPEFVEAGGRLIFDRATNTVKTVMITADAAGRFTEEVRFGASVQVFKIWCALMRETEAEIDAHFARQNILSMSDFAEKRAHAESA